MIHDLRFKNKVVRIMVPIGIIVLAAVLRLVPHPANIAPITAMALFGGVYLPRKFALILPLSAMFLSDIFLGFHSTMLFVYGSFVLIGGIGMIVHRYKSINTVLLAAIISSILFFLITNFGVWAMGNLYPKTLHGLVESYIMGIPFFRNTILGDFFYTGVFFGGFELVYYMEKKVKFAK